MILPFLEGAKIRGTDKQNPGESSRQRMTCRYGLVGWMGCSSLAIVSSRLFWAAACALSTIPNGSLGSCDSLPLASLTRAHFQTVTGMPCATCISTQSSLVLETCRICVLRWILRAQNDGVPVVERSSDRLEASSAQVHDAFGKQKQELLSVICVRSTACFVVGAPNRVMFGTKGDVPIEPEESGQKRCIHLSCPEHSFAMKSFPSDRLSAGCNFHHRHNAKMSVARCKSSVLAS